ncbi:hypothetical protein KC992_00355 [Candidatus Saccharibacteria bacterium]|nr:hypothetical protein [Candidatus Saccharibacteria bacterium]
MDFANRGNRPMQQQQPAPQMSSDMESSMSQKSGKKGLDFSKLSSVFVLFGVALITAVMIIGLVFGGKGNRTNKEADLIQTDKYQAVFLNSQDGQVYFGKLGVYNSDTYVLQDIYYVRVENPVQPEGQNQQQQANISLAKLGNELHGPQDQMYIARSQVLFWENLKDDGQVVKAITEYKANGGNTTNNTNTQQTQDQTQATQPAGTDQQSDTTDTETQTP